MCSEIVKKGIRVKENNKEYYKEILIKRYHYPKDIAEKTVFDLEAMDDECKEYFERYMEVEELEKDLFYKGYSVKELMKEYQMMFPAAVIFISNLKKDYDEYSALLNIGIK